MQDPEYRAAYEDAAAEIAQADQTARDADGLH